MEVEVKWKSKTLRDKSLEAERSIRPSFSENVDRVRDTPIMDGGEQNMSPQVNSAIWGLKTIGDLISMKLTN